MTQVEQTARPAPADRDRRVVTLRELAVAPENLRFGEPADDGIPQLAAAILAAGVLQPLTVRPGRGRKEAPWMALDGRRRFLALTHLAEAGAVDGDYPIEVFVETDPARQAAAVVLTNTAVPVHVADVIVAIGRMLKAKLGVSEIAAALGHAELEIKRLASLSALPAVAMDALRAGRMTLKQARLVARLGDSKAQREICRLAMEGHGFQDWRVRETISEGRVTVEDGRFTLVGPEAYAGAGGRVEADLFGELPDRLLDPAVLTTLWERRVGPIVRALETDRRTVRIAVGDDWELADGLEPFGYVRAYDLSDEARAVYGEARERHERRAEAAGAFDPHGDEVIAALAETLLARIAMTEAGSPGRSVTAVILKPARGLGVDATCFGPLPEAEPAGAADEDAPAAAEVPPDWPAVDVEGVSNAQHRARMEIMTHGLARAVADDWRMAQVFLVARLYDLVVLGRNRAREDSATVLTADVRRRPDHRSIETLNGEIERRLAGRRAAQEASGLAPLDWIASLEDVERARLLAEVFALTIDLREPRTDQLRHPARAEARAWAALCDADVSACWTPDAEFLSVHGKAQLVAMLRDMGDAAVDAERLKKPDLVERVAATAAERRWIPEALRWTAADEFPPADEAEAEGPPWADSEGEGEAGRSLAA